MMLLEYINNTTIIQKLTHWATILISRLGKSNKLNGINDSVSYEEFTHGFKKWNEGSYTSSIARNLVQSKGLLINNNCSKEYNEKKTMKHIWGT